MPIVEAEAIVIRHYALSEADKIVVLLTRESGKMRAAAHGLRKPKSRLAAALEPLNHVRAQIYAREGAELGYIRQVETLHSYLGRSPDLDRVYGFWYFAELAQELVEENHANPLMFRLLLATMDAGESLGVGELLVRYFELWALRLSGLLPGYDICAGCGAETGEGGFWASAEDGRGRCAACSGNRGIRLGTAAAGLLRRIGGLTPRDFASLTVPDYAVRDLERFTRTLLELHIEKRLKAYVPLKAILQERGPLRGPL